jgi:hypothetical protein
LQCHPAGLLILQDDIACRARSQQRRREFHFQLNGIVRREANSTVLQMNSIPRRPTSKSSTPKRSVARGDLAERFFQVQRLRKQVRDLERLAAADGHEVFAGRAEGRRNERTE